MEYLSDIDIGQLVLGLIFIVLLIKVRKAITKQQKEEERINISNPYIEKGKIKHLSVIDVVAKRKLLRTYAEYIPHLHTLRVYFNTGESRDYIYSIERRIMVSSDTGKELSLSVSEYYYGIYQTLIGQSPGVQFEFPESMHE